MRVWRSNRRARAALPPIGANGSRPGALNGDAASQGPRGERAHHHRWLRRGLVLGGILVLATSAGALTLGGRRIVAEEAAFRGPAAPRCVPSALNRTDLLSGTQLRVSPLPDSLDATPHTQISLLGVPGNQLKQITVSGSSTGVHPGRVAAFSQGDGESFLPAAPFQPGETVTVHGQLLAHGHWEPFAFHFAVSVPDPIPNQPPGKEPEGSAAEVQHYHSAPSLNSPSIQVDTGAGSSAAGDIFSAPYSGPGGDGPMITESNGQLVWFDPLPKGTYSTNLQVQSFEGQPVLTWWQGYIPPQGFGEGEEVVANSSYKQILHVHAGNGLTADLHDFHLGPNDTGLLTVFNPIRCNLTAYPRAPGRGGQRQPLPGNRPAHRPRAAPVGQRRPRGAHQLLLDALQRQRRMAVRLLPRQLARPRARRGDADLRAQHVGAVRGQ